MEEIRKALTIAGSDASGEAGLEADLKTFEELGVYGMTAITVVVTPNPDNNWSHDIYALPLAVIEEQLKTICKGVGCDAVKTGMLGSGELVELVARTIVGYKLRNVVVDPVLVCKGIDAIMVPEAAGVIKEKLVPLADVVTPNSFEAAYLADMERVETEEEAREAARRIHALGAKNVIIKSGSRGAGDTYTDLLFDGRDFCAFREPKIRDAYNMGAGCTFSSAIAAGLAKGMSIGEATGAAKEYITTAIKESFRLNEYIGALKHWSGRRQDIRTS